MSQSRLLFGSLGVSIAFAFAGCSSSDPVEPVIVQGGPTSGSVGGTAATAGSTTATTGAVGTTTSGVGGATSAGPTTGSASVTSGVASSTTAGAVTTGVGGSSTASSVTTSGLGGSTSTTDGTGGTAVVCNDISGEEFFKRPTECALCHGEDALGVVDDGSGVLGAGPEVRHTDPDYVRWIVRNGRMDHPDYPDGMEAYETCIVSDQMLEEIIVFLNSFPEPTDGEGLFNDYCANCHGPDGRGGVSGFNISGHSDETGQIASRGAHLGEFENRGEYMPTLDLTQEEINMIIDYLQNNLGLQ